MCGIFGYIGKKNPAEIVVNGLKKLEYRGYDSWGIAIKNRSNNSNNPNKQSNVSIFHEKHVGKIGNASLPHKSLSHKEEIFSEFNNNETAIGIGHTRWATHGGVTEQNAHPHFSCDKGIAVVHNGIIENFDSLKKLLIKEGHKFSSQTDTEVIAH